MTNQIVEIERLGQFGDGMVVGPNGPLAIPGALPGERVLVAVEESGPRLLEVVEPSPERIAPPCPHAADCGGCTMQHASRAVLDAWRTEQIRSALTHARIDADINPVVSVPAGRRRRVAFTATRTKKTLLLGFRRPRSHVITPVTGCLVALPEITVALPALQELALIAAPRKREIKLHVLHSLEGLDVVVEGGKALDLQLRQAAAHWVEAADIARLNWVSEQGMEVVAARRPPYLAIGRCQVAPPPMGFVQATAEGEAALVEIARQGVAGAKRIADLFCGCGAFALPLSAQAEVLAVDSEASAIEALQRGWREAAGVTGLRRVAAVTRDLFRRPLNPADLKQIDAVVLDPPRAGAEAQIQELAGSRVARIVSVSCNPSSFARDARTLIDAGFQMGPITPVDQFTWSPHLELAAVFSR